MSGKARQLNCVRVVSRAGFLWTTPLPRERCSHRVRVQLSQLLYKKWADDYSASHPEQKIVYESVGSGAGIQMFSTGQVQFGASDAAMTDEQIEGGWARAESSSSR